MSSVFELPIVYQHNKAENIRLMLETLNKLEMLSNTIFSKIESKIDENKKTLNSLQGRIDKTKIKVNNLKLRKEATIVFSPNHIEEKESKSESIFHKGDSDEFIMHKIVSQPEPFEGNSIFNNPSRYYSEKNQREEQMKMKLERKKKVNPKEKYFSKIGLGKIPQKLTSVSSFLIFNSNSNCYFEYDTSFDPLKGEDLAEDEDEIQTGIEDPIPPSMTGEVSVFSYDNIGIKFKPKSRQHKQFDNVGLGLDNVANTDWKDEFDDEASILPSSHIPDLPDVEGVDIDDDGPPTIKPETTGDEDDDDDMPAPPPPDVNGIEGSADIDIGDDDDDDDDDDMPPPPTMDDFDKKREKVDAPDDIEGLDDVGEEGEAAGTKPKPSGGEGSRENLMESIRNFRKNNLKKVDIKIGKKKKAVKKNVAVPNTLMGQLSQALLLRRKAMQGIKEEEDEMKNRNNNNDFGGDEIKVPKKEEGDEKKEGDAPTGETAEPEQAEDEWGDDDEDDDGWDD